MRIRDLADKPRVLSPSIPFGDMEMMIQENVTLKSEKRFLQPIKDRLPIKYNFKIHLHLEEILVLATFIVREDWAGGIIDFTQFVVDSRHEDYCDHMLCTEFLPMLE